MKKILIILLAIAFNVFAQGEGDRIVNPTWKLSSGALTPTVSTWTLTLPATTFSPSIVTPLIIGGTGTTSTLTYKTTSGVGATGARHIFVVGNNGGTEAMTILNDGKVGIGTTGPGNLLEVVGASKNVVFRGGAAETIDARFEFNNFGGVGGNRRLVFTASGPSIQALATNDGSVQSLFLNPSGGNVGIGNIAPGSKLEVTGKVAVQNQSAIAGTITSDYSVVYPYDDGSNVKVMALLDDAGTETTTQVATANMWGEPSGGAILNGTTQYYSHVDNDALDFGTGNFSFSAYVNMTVGTQQDIFYKRNTQYYLLRILTTGQIYCALNDGSTTYAQSSTINLISSTWYHIVVTQVFNSTFKIYINGIDRSGSVAGSVANTISNSGSFVIGHDYSLSTNKFIGNINFVRTYNYVLTQAEVTKRWNNGKPHEYVEPYATKGASNTMVATYDSSAVHDSTITLTTRKDYYWIKGSADSISVSTTKYTTSTKISYVSGTVRAKGDLTGSTLKLAGETFSIANTDWGASGAVCTIGGTKSIANSTAYPIAVSGKYDARKTIAANYEFTGTAKVGSILKYVKITNTIAGPDTISLGTSALGTQVINAQIIGATSTVIVNVDKWFSDSATQSLFLSGVNWAADNLEVVLIYEPIGEKL